MTTSETSQRSTGRVCESLKMFTGHYDMQMVEVGGLPSSDAFIGRRCINCAILPQRFIVIPTAKQLVLLCEDCINHMTTAPREPEITTLEHDLAVRLMFNVLASTDD